MDLQAHIRKAAADLLPHITSVRRHLHAHPELSFEEFKTAAFVDEQLKSMGIADVQTMANTGRVATIKGRNPEKKVVALRADMDALPIQEQNNVPYKSGNDGVMHACGHDVHTSSLLGAANILNGLKDQFEGTIKLVFQPGEEKLPGGASLMIKEGVLKNPVVNSMFGQHVMPFLPAGKVGFRSGLYMASTDEIYVTVKGKGGHGAMPHLNIDTVMITAQMLTALQQVVSRGANPTVPSVLSFGKVIANGATNVIPDEVYLEGTFRTLDEKWRKEAHQLMLKIANGVAESLGGSVEFNIMKGYPFLKNDEQLTAKAKQAAIDYLGADNVVDLDIWMAAEDFSFYSQEVPACFYRLGTRNEARGITSSVHTPTFDIDESALEVGMGLMAWQAIKELTV
ncbi:MAG: amidohydrolase [Bacteroidia bacterium]|nr:amidohydrolase [Bacteroidia bacterium]MBP7261016.1 amidohydrolase [Bacteroidia bacterium]MBP9179243.1 amidohydrolase [Bacteroidia bacterium]MBP9724335.1 amidohydrolase [Bacteroidia bacterium]